MSIREDLINQSARGISQLGSRSRSRSNIPGGQRSYRSNSSINDVNADQQQDLSEILNQMQFEPLVPPQAIDIDYQNLDQVIAYDNVAPVDMKQPTARTYLTGEQLNMVREQIDRIPGLSENQKRQALNQYSQEMQVKIRQRNAATEAEEDDVIAYLNTKSAAFSEGLANILKKIYPAFNRGQLSQKQVDPNLRILLKKAFLKKTQGGKIYMSIGNMVKASEIASFYDRAVIRKSKRIAKMIKSQISAASMKTDIPISKQYIAAKAYQSYYKVGSNPRAKISFIKGIAKKYNTVDRQQYQENARRNFNQGNERVRNSVYAKINNPIKFDQYVTETTEDQAKNFNDLILQKIKNQ